jgi:hypothetical protein
MDAAVASCRHYAAIRRNVRVAHPEYGNALANRASDAVAPEPVPTARACVLHRNIRTIAPA